MPADLRRYLMEKLDAAPADVFATEGILGLNDTEQLIVDERPDLVFTPYNARFPERIRDFGGIALRRFGRRTSLATIPMRASTSSFSSSGKRRATRR